MDEQAFADGLPTGTVLREYVIEATIGQGGYGVVYRARHRYLDRVVALKEYFPTTVAIRTSGTVRPRNLSVTVDYKEGLRRFIEEARRLEQFRSHAGVITCLGFFEERGTAYLAMEYEDGLPLSDLLAKREAAASPLAEGELLQLAEQLLESLSAVHEAGVLHRDIKPSNILVRRSNERPVLIDFGAAKTDFGQRTKSYAPQTEGYAAIEQAEEDGELGPWTDLYGLGVVLWRIVAGGHRPKQRLVPVPASSRLFARLRSQNDPLPSARELGAGRFSSRVLSAIDKCLELDPKDRPTTCEELLTLLSVPVRLGDIYYWGEGVTQDRAHAAEWYRKAADEGDAIASRKLGFMNLWGLGVPQDPALAVESLRKAANDGDADSQSWLAYMFHLGLGVPQDRELAVEWYRKAVDQDDAIVALLFGDRPPREEHAMRDLALAAEWYRKAAGDGDAEAQVWLADVCLAKERWSSRPDPNRVARAIEWLKEAAHQRFSVAQLRLGDLFLLLRERGDSIKITEAIEWYQRSASRGNTEAQRKLGMLYKDWHFFEGDPDSGGKRIFEFDDAAEWLLRAAEQGDAGAQAALAGMYHDGLGVLRDDTLAAIWIGKAYDQGCDCERTLVSILSSESGAKALVAEWLHELADQGAAIAQGLMGDLYRDGVGVRRDAGLAAEWYRKAADQGDADAQGTLGFMYYRGDGVSEDHALAREWLVKAAEQGNNWARQWLCEVDAGGEHIPRVLGAEWYRKATDQGQTAQQWLGETMYCGGVNLRNLHPPEWLRRAADLGSVVAQCLMGDRYYCCSDLARAMSVDGDGDWENYGLAAEWYRKSAEQGFSVAQRWLGHLYHRGEGVPEDDARAGEWLGRAAAQGDNLGRYQADDLWHLVGTEWLRKAADHGTAIAQRLMGDLYRHGECVGKDAALAVEWYRKAADQRDHEALTCLGAMLHDGEDLS